MKIGENRIAVIGQGYVGLPLAMAAIGAGFAGGLDALASKYGL